MVRARLRAAVAAACLLAAACGDEQRPRTRPPAQAPAPEERPQAPALHERLAGARGMAARPPESPARHYFATGAASFREKGGREITQPLRLQIGGPGRLRYELESQGVRNVFILERPGTAWVRTPQEPGGAAHDPVELGQDAWIRWTVARFPWDWEQELAAARLQPDPQTGRMRLTLDGPLGPFSLGFDEDLRPSELQMAGAAVRFGDWRALSSGTWMPFAWEWQKPWGVIAEQFQVFLDGSLFLDESFRRPGSPPPAIDWVAALPQEQARQDAPTEFGRVQRPAMVVVEGPDRAGWRGALEGSEQLAEPDWLLIEEDGGRRRAARVLSAEPPALPPGSGLALRRVPAATWLRWTTVRAGEPAAGAARMRAAAAGNQLRAEGPVWLLAHRPAGDYYLQEYLLQVREGG